MGFSLFDKFRKRCSPEATERFEKRHKDDAASNSVEAEFREKPIAPCRFMSAARGDVKLIRMTILRRESN